MLDIPTFSRLAENGRLNSENLRTYFCANPKVRVANFKNGQEIDIFNGFI